jgi:hypothetical protein
VYLVHKEEKMPKIEIIDESKILYPDEFRDMEEGDFAITDPDSTGEKSSFIIYRTEDAYEILNEVNSWRPGWPDDHKCRILPKGTVIQITI